MKSQERHELKTNELADWLVHFPEWLKKNNGTIVYIIVLIVVVIAAWIIRHHYSTTVVNKNALEFTSLVNKINIAKMETLRNKSQGTDTSYLFTDIANDLQQFADKVGKSPLKAAALIARGDALRMELCYRGQTVGAEQAASALEPAKESYKKAMDIVPADSSVSQKAKLGLGLCEEQAGQTEAARAIYQELLKAQNIDEIVATQASFRLSIMDGFTGNILLVDKPMTVKEPQTQLQQLPEITFGQTDTNEQSTADSNAAKQLPADSNTSEVQ